MMMIKFELFLGRNRWMHTEISERAFREFEEKYIKPRLSAYTITSSVGYFEGTEEHVKILTYITPSSALREIIKRIAKDYKREMQQESVLMVETEVKGDFV